MIVFGTCLGNQDQFDKLMAPGIARSCGTYPHVIVAKGSPGKNVSIFAVYNQVLREARLLGDVEALVLLHTDLELRDPQFAAKVKKALSLPNVAVIGTIGGENLESIGWWESKGPKRGYARDLPNGVMNFGFRNIDVDGVDGLMLILSPWALQHLNFDEQTYNGFHGYDADLCFQAKDAGKRVIVQQFDFMHHAKNGFTGGISVYNRNNAAFKRKWSKLFRSGKAPDRRPRTQRRLPVP